jgi:hypothetical protein
MSRTLFFEPLVHGAGRGVVPRSYLRGSCKLAAFFHRRRPPLIDIGGKIDKMHAAVGLLARFDPHDRQDDIATERLAQKLRHRQMAEEVAADLVQWHDGLTIVLGH